MKQNHSSTAQIALFAALVAALGMIPKIDLPLGVPVTPQTLGVMLAGCLIGSRRGSAAMLLFLLAVAMGLPLLSGGRGGLGVFAAPSVGYLLGWPVGALITGCVLAALPHSSVRSATWSAATAALIGGVLIVHACGVLGLVIVAKFTLRQALVGTLAFIPGDLIKCVLCALVVRSVARGMPHWLNQGAQA